MYNVEVKDKDGVVQMKDGGWLVLQYHYVFFNRLLRFLSSMKTGNCTGRKESGMRKVGK